MDASALQDRIRAQRDLKDIYELTVQYREQLVLLDGDRIGLTERDLPGDTESRDKVGKVLVEVLADRGWSLGLDVVLGMREVNSLFPNLGLDGIRAILLSDHRLLIDPKGTRVALASWGERRTDPSPDLVLELAEGLGEGFTTRMLYDSVEDLYSESPSTYDLIKILRSTLKWMQTPSGKWLRTPPTIP